LSGRVTFYTSLIFTQTLIFTFRLSAHSQEPSSGMKYLSQHCSSIPPNPPPTPHPPLLFLLLTLGMVVLSLNDVIKLVGQLVSSSISVEVGKQSDVYCFLYAPSLIIPLFIYYICTVPIYDMIFLDALICESGPPVLSL
jgi:hypothetical protein